MTDIIMCTRASEVVACARSWLGTRFLHQGRLKKSHTHKGGVDCLGLLVGVASELELVDAKGAKLKSYDNTHYTRMPDTTKLRHVLAELLIPKPSHNIEAGDIALFELAGNPQHLAIVGEGERGELTLIHAYAQARKVVEHNLDDFWKEKLVGAYRLSSY